MSDQVGAIGTPSVQLYSRGCPINQLVVVPYVSGTPIPIDLCLGDTFVCVVTDAAAVTIGAPFRSDGGPLPLGHRIVISIRNLSGGVMGTLSFDGTGFKGNTSATPANLNTRSWFMYYSSQTNVGNRWVFYSGTPADVPTN